MSGNEIIPLLIMAAMLTGVAIYVSQPLLRARSESLFVDDFEETPLQPLLVRKDSIYSAISELEFDYTTGKLSIDDYNDLREKYAMQAAEVLKEIDEFEAGGNSDHGRKRKTACPDCGFNILKEDRFCQSCGTEIT
ncbi:MAG TPA: zinc ribbon domain-containing protein [Actinobacteria bacterium]|nr:zinc ribbon domain-containing protein [Actinomycetota bacterium]